MNSVEYDRIFHPYAAGTQVNTRHNGYWEGKIPAQQIDGINARTHISAGRQDYDIGGDGPRTEIMK